MECCAASDGMDLLVAPNPPLDRTAGVSGVVQIEALRCARVRSAARRSACGHEG